MKTGKAIKKPIPVDFIRLDADEDTLPIVHNFIYGNYPDDDEEWYNLSCQWFKQGFMPLKTLESGQGTQNANFGDYILKGIDGECWPIKADIFERTYDIA